MGLLIIVYLIVEIVTFQMVVSAVAEANYQVLMMFNCQIISKCMYDDDDYYFFDDDDDDDDDKIII
jgi:hypothetical protein